MFKICPKSRAKGIDLIDEVTDHFTEMIDKLDTAVRDCRQEQRMIRLQKQSCVESSDRHDVLKEYITHASGIASKLRFIIE